MNACFYRLKSWVALLGILAPFLAVAGGPDTTLLDDTKRSFRDDFRDWRTSDSNRLHLLANSRVTNIVIIAVTNGPGGLGSIIGPAPTGALVKKVMADTPAWRGGLHENDLIIYIDNQPLVAMPLHDIALRLRGPIGSEVELTLLRPGEPQPLKIRLKRELVPPLPAGFRL